MTRRRIRSRARWLKVAAGERVIAKSITSYNCANPLAGFPGAAKFDDTGGRRELTYPKRMQPTILSPGRSRIFLLRRIEFVVKDHRFGDAARFLQSFGSTNLAARRLSNDGVEFFVEKAA